MVNNILWIALIVFVLSAPFYLGVVSLNLIAQVGILAVLVMSSNLLTGVSGQISIAQGSFMGIGGYVVAILVSQLGWPIVATLPVSILAAAMLGGIAGLPALRITGINLALVTLAIAIVFPAIVTAAESITRGHSGIGLQAPLPAPSWFPYPDSVLSYWVLIAITAITLWLSRNMLASRVGRNLVALRDHQLLASSMGVDIRLYKIVIFAVSGGVAGLSGWMFVVHYQFISPLDVTLFLSINVLLAMTLGGAGTIAGPLIGAAFLQFSPALAAAVHVPPILVPAAQGAVLILALLLLPRGIAGSFHQLLDRWRAPGPDRPEVGNRPHLAP